jgi:hypothetical protein
VFQAEGGARNSTAVAATDQKAGNFEQAKDDEKSEGKESEESEEDYRSICCR